MSLRCTYCFPFSTSCSQVSSNCNSLFSLGSCWWDWDGDPVVWAEQFMAISHHSPGLEPRAATPVSSPGKSATWKTAVLGDNNNGIAWRDNVTNATVLEQTGSMTMHFIQSQHRWNLQFLTTTCSDEALTPWPSLKPSVLCTLSLYLYHRPKLPNPLPLPHLFHHHQRNPPTYPDTRPNIPSHIQDEWKFIDHYYAWNSMFTFLCSMRKNKGKITLTKTAVTAVYMQR